MTYVVRYVEQTFTSSAFHRNGRNFRAHARPCIYTRFFARVQLGLSFVIIFTRPRLIWFSASRGDERQERISCRHTSAVCAETALTCVAHSVAPPRVSARTDASRHQTRAVVRLSPPRAESFEARAFTPARALTSPMVKYKWE